ncbi:family 3 putative carbohydrate esterase [Podospora australis]|uniref:Family 3 putative carbohydrate esterase n=1 Tax=Podospora australis TaxID=1536484 RepID=A0AAN7AI33_9PEZI|nr:family 3 putative carbohydrate esterase [Podospora australis]
MVFLPINNLLLALATPLANHGVAVNHFNLGARAVQPLGNAVPLRIMPLGASITFGQASTHGNGYRAELRTQLTTAGNKVNMVGSRQSGTMADNDVEGWPGLRIEQVHQKALDPKSVSKFRPNVFLINAGTNDAVQNKNVSTAGERMEAMITDLYRLSPRAVIVLSTLLMNKGQATEQNVLNINRQFVNLVNKLRNSGRRIVLADMHNDAGPVWSDLADETHPNDGGYRKMANIWFAGLLATSDEGWLQAPEYVQNLPDSGPN